MNTIVIALFFTTLTTAVCAQRVSRDGPAISPFRGMRAIDAGIEVQVTDDTWWELESVAGVDTATLLREATRLCGNSAWKRITEDLPALLDAMGHTVGDAVDVEVRDLTTGEVKKLPAVKMTGENRQRVKQANGGRSGPRVEPAPQMVMSRVDALADLQALRRLLDEQFAYRTLRAVDLEALMAQAEKDLGAGPLPPGDLTRIVDRILRAFGDGHSRVDGMSPLAAAFGPFLVQAVAGGHVAFLPDRSAFLDAERPFVVAIDGVPIERWLAAAQALATQGSQTMQARQAERGLRELGDLRLQMQLPAVATVRVTLRAQPDRKLGTAERELPMAQTKPAFGAWPRTKTRTLDGGIGYLRIEQMQGDPDFLDEIDAAMKGFATTKGLVIDVRGNGGGTRDALRRLAPYFLPARGAPVVGNVAAILAERGRPLAPEALADRGLYQADWPGWTDAQRAAITGFARTWKPSWKLPTGKFSPWHFLVLDRSDHPTAFAYERKVIVLIDRGCFSATDVFAAALGALPNVTLVGEATSGGSGRARGFSLPKSGIRLQLSSMASFRPDGVLFEGNGVEPDVVVAMQASDLLGTTDSALTKAIELLR